MRPPSTAAFPATPPLPGAPTPGRRRQIRRRTLLRVLGAVTLLLGLFAGATMPASAATVSRTLPPGEPLFVEDGELMPGCPAEDGAHRVAFVGFVAGESKQYTIATTGAVTPDEPVLVVVRGDGIDEPGPGDVLGCAVDDGDGDADASLTVDLVAGEHYVVVVTTAAAERAASYEISITDPVAVDFSLRSLEVQDVGETSATARLESEGPAAVHWIVWSGPSPTPSAEAIELAAGTPGCGGITDVVACGSEVLLPATPTMVALTGLTSGTGYRIAVTGASDNGVVSQPVVKPFATTPFFTVTVAAGLGGHVTPDATPVPAGGFASFDLHPYPGKTVGSIAGCGGSLLNGRFTTAPVTADCTITVAFVDGGSGGTGGTGGDGGDGGSGAGGGGTGGTWPLDVWAGPGGTVSPGPGSIGDGQTRTFTITPDAGQIVAHVGGCGGQFDPSNPTTFTTGPVVAPCAVYAFFLPSGTNPPPTGDATNGWIVSTITTPGGSASPAQTIVPDGGTTPISLTPDAGFWLGYMGGCPGTLPPAAAGEPIGSFTVGPVSSGCTLFVAFRPSGPGDGGNGTGGGGGTGGDGGGTGGGGTPPPATIWPLDVIVGAGGTVSPGPGSIANGETRSFSVTPDAGNVVAHAGGCGGTMVGTTFTTAPVTGPCVVGVFFRPSDAVPAEPGDAVSGWRVEAVAGPGGAVTPSEVVVADGGSAAIAIAPQPLHTFAYAGGCPGMPDPTTGSFVVGPITGPCTLFVGFRFTGNGGGDGGTGGGDGGDGGGNPQPTTWPVNAVANPGGSITPASTQVTDGATAEFIVTPADGFVVDHVDGCGGVLSGDRFTTGPVRNGCTVNAFFRPAGGPGENGPFEVRTFAVGGSLAPTSAMVDAGETATFAVAPGEGNVLDVIGGCGGALVGETFTTAPATGPCTVYAFFRPTSGGGNGGGGNGGGNVRVNAMASPGGEVQPAFVDLTPGQSATFQVSVQPGFALDHIGGCGGTFASGTFTTGAVGSNCNVYVVFKPETSTGGGGGDNGGGDNGGGSGGGSESPVVKAFAGPGGSIDPAYAPVPVGGTASLTVTPADGFAVDRVIGCEGTLTGTTYATAPVQASCNVYAFFRPLETPGGGDAPGDPVNGWRLRVVTYGPGAADPMSTVVADGESATITLTPAGGAAVDLVDGCPLTPLPAASQVVVGPLTGDCTLYVAFHQPSNEGWVHPVALFVGPNGDANFAATAGATASFQPGDTVAVEIAPAPGYVIDLVAGCDGTLVDSTYTTGPVNEPCVVAVFFRPVEGFGGGNATEGWTVGAFAGPGGSVTPTVTVVGDGGTATVTVTPEPGHDVAFVGGCGGTADPATGSYTTGPVTGSCMVYAVFQPTGDGEGGDDGGNGDGSVVRGQAGPGGSITPTTTPATAGQLVSLTVTPEPTHELDYVGGCGGSLSGTTFTTAPFSGPCTVYAFFRPLDAPPGGGGSGGGDIPVNVMVNVPPGQNAVTPPMTSVEPGSSATFTIAPPADHVLDFVGGCGATLTGLTVTTATLDAPCTVYVMFRSLVPGGGDGGNGGDGGTGGNGGTGGGGTGGTSGPWTVTAEAGEGGSVSPAEQSVANGATGTVTVSPEVGFEVDEVTGCGGTLEGESYTTGAVTAACTITATFVRVGYPATASAGEGGEVTPSYALVPIDETATFTLLPSSGHRVLSVTGCPGELDGATFVVGPLTEGCELVATFERIPHTVTATVAGSGGTISPTSSVVRHGDTAVFAVTPAVGHRVSVVEGCGVARTDRGYITAPITAPCTVTARFVPITYTLTGAVAAGGGGTITPTSSTVNHGARGTFTVTPATGYAVKGVTGCGGALVGTTYTTGPVTASCTVTASFQLKTYTVTAVVSTAGGGTLTPTSSTVNHGARATLTATPATGFEIDTITGCAGTRSSSTFTTGAVTANCTVTASFKRRSYTVTATAGTGGTITPASSLGAHGSRVTLTVTPEANFVVDTVTGCAGAFVAPTYTTGALTGPCTVTATFKPRQVTVTALAGPGGTVTPASTTVNAGSPVTLTVTAAAGFAPKSVTGCGGTFASGRFTIAAVTTSCEVQATFASTSGYTAVAPVRVLAAKTFAAAETATIPVVGTTTAVPASARAVVVNVGVSRPAANGSVTLFPCGTTRPTLPSMSFVAGQPAVGGIVVRPGTGGVCLYASTGLTAAVDVVGYFGTTGGQGFIGLAGIRVVDTRTTGGIIAAGTVRELVIGGTRGVTADASAVTGALTVPAQTTPGAVTVYACGTTRPATPTLAFPAGRALTVGFTARLGATKLCVHATVGTHVTVDLTGFFSPAGDHVFSPISVGRLLDTRTTSILAAGVTREVQVTGRATIPASASAVTLTITSVGPTAAGSVTVWPCGVTKPATTLLSFAASQTASSQVTVKVGTGGKVCVASTVGTHVTVDANGHHAPPVV